MTVRGRDLIGRLRAETLVRFVVFSALLALAAVACGGNNDGHRAAPSASGSTTALSQRFSAVIVTEDLSTVSNRFAVGVIDEQSGKPLLKGAVSLRFFKVLSGNQGQLKFEKNTNFIGFPTYFIDPATEKRVMTGDTGVYVSSVDFDETGDWAVEIGGSANGEAIGPITLPLKVVSSDQVLNIGDPAPRTRQKIASDVADISEIDSMRPTDPFHEMTIGDAVGSGRPTVLFFGTPAFCKTRSCAPVMETVMFPLYEMYGSQVNFIHVEPYLLEELRKGTPCAVPAFNAEFARQGLGEGSGQCPKAPEQELQAAGESWNLTSEPIVFVIDRDGKIAGKFEGIVAPQEVEEVLSRLSW